MKADGVIDWPAENPELAQALLGSVFHAQGVLKPGGPLPGARRPWNVGKIAGFEPVIRDSLKDHDLTLDEVLEGVAAGWFQPWTLGGAILITELIVSPRIRALHVLIGGGNLKDLEELTPGVEWVATQAGCNFVGATGRKGWSRWLKRFGYAPDRCTTVQKRIG